LGKRLHTEGDLVHRQGGNLFLQARVIGQSRRMICGGHVHGFVIKQAVNSNRFNFSLRMFRSRQRTGTWAASSVSKTL